MNKIQQRINDARASGVPHDMALNHPLGKNPGDIWEISTQPYAEAHFACVDEITECLTLTGWKKYPDLRADEIIATFDLKSGTLRWERLEEVLVYDFDSEMLHLSNLNLGFLVTFNHRMVCTSYRTKSKEWSPYYIKEASEITSHDRFPVVADWEDGSYGINPNEPSQDVCELLGWILSEGDYRKYSIGISQSLTINPDKCDNIERLLRSLNIQYKKYISNRVYTSKKTGIKKPFQMLTFSIKWEYTKSIRQLLPNKKLQWSMVLWSKEGLVRFLKGIIDGDGHRRSDNRIQIVQKDKNTIDFIQIIEIGRASCRERV